MGQIHFGNPGFEFANPGSFFGYPGSDCDLQPRPVAPGLVTPESASAPGCKALGELLAARERREDAGQ